MDRTAEMDHVQRLVSRSTDVGFCGEFCQSRLEVGENVRVKPHRRAGGEQLLRGKPGDDGAGDGDAGGAPRRKQAAEIDGGGAARRKAGENRRTVRLRNRGDVLPRPAILTGGAVCQRGRPGRLHMPAPRRPASRLLRHPRNPVPVRRLNPPPASRTDSTSSRAARRRPSASATIAFARPSPRASRSSRRGAWLCRTWQVKQRSTSPAASPEASARTAADLAKTRAGSAPDPSSGPRGSTRVVGPAGRRLFRERGCCGRRDTTPETVRRPSTGCSPGR